jgi:RNA recognition motif-containing protein
MTPGVKVLVNNINEDITTEAVEELFGSVGELKRARIVIARGRPIGKAEVWFARQRDATDAVFKFHQRMLDGKPMEVRVAPTEAEPDNGRQPQSQQQQQQQSQQRQPAFQASFGGGRG